MNSRKIWIKKDINMGAYKIVSYRNPNDLNELVNKSYVNQKVSQASGSVDLSDYLKKDGSEAMAGDLNLKNQKIVNLKKASQNSDGVNLEQVNEGISTFALQNRKLLSNYIKRDGSTTMTNDFNTGNKIINLKKGTKPSDAVTPEQLGESHVSSHENRKNVFEYIMKTQTELTTDFGIYSVSLLVYNFTPHLINKAAYKLTKKN